MSYKNLPVIFKNIVVKNFYNKNKLSSGMNKVLYTCGLSIGVYSNYYLYTQIKNV